MKSILFLISISFVMVCARSAQAERDVIIRPAPKAVSKPASVQEKQKSVKFAERAALKTVAKPERAPAAIPHKENDLKREVVTENKKTEAVKPSPKTERSESFFGGLIQKWFPKKEGEKS